VTTLPKCYLVYSSADADEAARFVEVFDSQHAFLLFHAESGVDQEIANCFGRHEVLKKIRERWLRDSIITIVLIGASDSSPEKIDLEIAASLYEDASCHRSGLLGISLPSAAKAAMRMPPRFADNWAHGTGYARWYRYPEDAAALESMIADALDARATRADLVNNQRPLMESVLTLARERTLTDSRETPK